MAVSVEAAAPETKRMSMRGPAAKTKYEIYKEATAAVSSWLSCMARQVGIHMDLNGNQQEGGRLMSHQYKIYVDVIVSAKPVVKVPARILRLAQMTCLARSKRNQYVRGHDLESDRRHEHFISVIKEVYDKLHAHFEKHGTNEEKNKAAAALSEQEQQHRRGTFYDLLELEDLEDQSDNEEAKEDTCVADQVEAAVDKKKKKSKKTRDRLKAKREVLRNALEQLQQSDDEDEEDPYFVLLCLLADLKAMRAYIKEIWTEYKEGKIDLMTVSVTTNATFDIIRKYKADVPAIKRLLDNYPSTLDVFFSRYLPGAHQKDMGIFSDFSPHLERQMDVVKYMNINEELTDMTFANSLYFLTGRQYFGRLLDSRQLDRIEGVSVKDDFFFRKDSCRDDKRPWATKNFAERLEDDRGSLASLNLDLNVCILARTMVMPDSIVLDDITAEWLEYPSKDSKYSKPTVTLAQAFGGQLYLDIKNVLQGEARRGCAQLQEKCVEILKSIAMCRKESPDHAMVDRLYKSQLKEGYRPWKKLPDDVNNLTASEVHAYIFHDASNHYNAKKFLNSPDVEDHYFNLEDVSLFENHPLLSGIIMFQLTQAFRLENALFTSSWCTIVVAAQLYYACKLHRDLRTGAKKMTSKKSVYIGSGSKEADWTKKPLHWTEMDYLFDLLGADHFFFKILPKSNIDLLLYADATEASVASDCYRKIMEERRGAGVGDIYKLPRDGGNSRGNLDLGVLQDHRTVAISFRLFLAKYSKREEEMSHRHISDWTEEDLKILLKSKADLYNDSKSHGQLHFDSQVGLLKALKAGLQEEYKASDFNLLSFHVYCLRLLRFVSEQLPKVCPSLPYHRHPMTKHPGFADQKNHLDVEFLAYTIFNLMGVPEVSFGQQAGGSEEPVITDPVIISLDEVISSFIATNEYPQPFECDLKVWKAGKPPLGSQPCFESQYDYLELPSSLKDSILSMRSQRVILTPTSFYPAEE